MVVGPKKSAIGDGDDGGRGHGTASCSPRSLRLAWGERLAGLRVGADTRNASRDEHLESEGDHSREPPSLAYIHRAYAQVKYAVVAWAV